MNDATRTAIQTALEGALAVVDQAQVDGEDAGDDVEAIITISYHLRDALEDLRDAE